jgi:hypothetical protein
MGDRRTRQRCHVPDAPADAVRVSLAGPPFEKVLKGLLAVDPKNLPKDEEADNGDPS